MKRKSESGNKQPFERKKTELVFDPQKRVEFLTGFHKRKQHRRKIAQGEMQRKLKEETKRIRTEAKEKMKNLYHSYKPIPELTEEDKAEDQEEEYDTENVTVKVVELSTRDLAKENNWLGENRVMVNDDNESEAEGSASDDEEELDEHQLGVIPGMELEGEKKVKRKHKPLAEEDANDDTKEKDDKSAMEKVKPKKGPVLNLDGIRSKKELNHKLKRYALKSMKNSQAFRQKERVHKQKQLKKSRRIRHQKEKHLKQKKGFRDRKAAGTAGGRDSKRKRKDD
ncbi:nucleolar protein 12 [Anopheles maculipalpis]|uniref:nucleolar protein 12 n=1 Tax=Anopheles maculipalpis TaxID=1496333 RepID=UPI0021593E3B|nr:nucleolar protein 12 [Anopheles maculipalpis]